MPENVRRVVAKDREVYEAIGARKGPVYALQVSMFVACTKMQVELFGPNRATMATFAENLLHCFGLQPQDYDEFLQNAAIIRKAQML